MARTRMRLRSRILIGVGITIAALAGLTGAAVLVVTAPAPDFPGRDAASTNTWYQVDGGEQTRAADGSDYRFYVKTGSSDNLIIFFGGGGVTWDAASAANPITVGKFVFAKDPGDYFPNIPPYFLRTFGGFLDADNPANPFNDWTVVVIPYATGDFHTGDAVETLTTVDGTSTTMHYNGRENVTRVLDWTLENLPTPTKLLISGSSAGAFGSTFWTPTIARSYPESTVYQFSDGNQLPYDEWPRVADELWHADWKNQFGYEPGSNLYETAVRANREQLGDNVVILDSNTLYDGTLIAFTAKIQGTEPDATAWSLALRDSMRRLNETVPNYYFYLTDYGLDPKTGTTPHTMVSLAEFYTAQQDGVAFSTWLADAVIRDDPYSVGQKLLD